MQMQEDLRKRLEAGDGETGEEAIESYLESKQKMMLDSLWELNVADIELTLSHVCQQVLRQAGVKKDVLRQRAKALKKMGTIFQGVKNFSRDYSLRQTDDGSLGSEPQNPQLGPQPKTFNRADNASFNSQDNSTLLPRKRGFSGKGCMCYR
jgi:hypothetical protein